MRSKNWSVTKKTMIEIINGKKHFKLPQPKEDLAGCNVRLEKKKEIAGKVHPKGWCLCVDNETANRWVKSGEAKLFKLKELRVESSPILDSKGENIEKVVETESQTKTK